MQDLTAEAVLTGSRDIALQVLLVDLVVNRVQHVEQLLETMLDLQREYPGHL